MKKIYLLFTLLFIVLVSNGQEMRIQVAGNVLFDNSMFSITEAGNDFSAAIENTTSVYISMEYTDFWDNFRQNKAWRINIQKEDILWDSKLILETRRTGDGNRYLWFTSNVFNGTSYHQISNTSTYFFSGSNTRTNIPINFKLSGMSVTMGAKDFETNIMLTVYDE